jgi:hypothetical protein
VAEPLTVKEKKNVKEEGWPIQPQGVAGHPLDHGGGRTTPVKKKKKKKKKKKNSE